MILGLQQQLKEDGIDVSLAKLCRWFEIPRRTVYYTPTKAKPKLQDRFVTPKAIERTTAQWRIFWA
jgi:putative transposase